jgi:hypothetical protein
MLGTISDAGARKEEPTLVARKIKSLLIDTDLEHCIENISYWG